ncbi:hypothetical protein [Massilia niabensis]|uniref:Uncharacterized protein n=1 Tax=Massilia niabensis TaxID=544910 RepID=A0ABW0L3A6_9BURK
MDRAKNLQAKALTLRSLLEQYAPHDADVKEAYGWVSSLLDAVDSGSAVLPTKFPFGWIFFRGENNLLAYPDLCGAAADFADALEGDSS